MTTDLSEWLAGRVEAGRLRLDASVEPWLPGLADRQVLVDPGAPLDDTVPAVRPMQLLRLRTG